MSRRRFLLHLAMTAMVVGIAVSSARGLGPPATPVHDAFGHGPEIALVHGLGSQPECWLGTARRLARHHRVALIELPGHGDSPPAGPLSLERAVAALDAALAAESREPVVLVGHSIGGLVAAAEAIRNPSRVRALVLVETALRPQIDGAERAALLEALDADYAGTLRAAYLAFGRDSVQGLELYREAAAQEPSSLKPWIRLALTADLSAAAAKLHQPTLAVVGERSWEPGESWASAARALGYERIPALRHARIEGTGHFVMLDRPDALADAIERFIAHPEGDPLATR